VGAPQVTLLLLTKLCITAMVAGIITFYVGDVVFEDDRVSAVGAYTFLSGAGLVLIAGLLFLWGIGV
jgi:hypothetical protein